MNPRVTILIVNYNSGAVLPACLRSLRQWTEPVHDEILIVDNGSTDGSVAAIRQDFPEARWIRAGANLGFGRANNLAAAQAQGEYLFMLNPDTELRSPVTRQLAALLDRDDCADIGCAGASIVNPAGEPDVAAGNFPTPLGLLKELFPSGVFPYRLDARPRGDDLLEVDYVSGAGLFMRRALFEQVGGFDPDFFLYFEETELQYRLRRRGYRQVVCTEACLMHIGGTPDHKASPRKIELFESSRVLFHRKCFGWIGGLWARCYLLLFYGSRLLAGAPRHFAAGLRVAFHSHAAHTT
jgi:GT2 family glycosyltransferase